MRTAEAIYGSAGMIPYNRTILANRVWDYSVPYPQYSPGFLDADGSNAYMEKQRIAILNALRAPQALNGLGMIDVMNMEESSLALPSAAICSFAASRLTGSIWAGVAAGAFSTISPKISAVIAAFALVANNVSKMKNPCSCGGCEDDCHCDDNSLKNPCPCGGCEDDCHCED